jgi:hypothetical protein
MESVDFGYINVWLAFYAWTVAGFCGLILATVMGLPFEITVLSLIRIKGDQIKRDSIALFVLVCLFAGSTYAASNALHAQMDEENTVIVEAPESNQWKALFDNITHSWNTPIFAYMRIEIQLDTYGRHYAKLRETAIQDWVYRAVCWLPLGWGAWELWRSEKPFRWKLNLDTFAPLLFAGITLWVWIYTVNTGYENLWSILSEIARRAVSPA